MPCSIKRSINYNSKKSGLAFLFYGCIRNNNWQSRANPCSNDLFITQKEW